MVAKCLDSALNVKVVESQTSVVSGGSNYETQMVAKCLDSALNVKVVESQTSVGKRREQL